MKLLNYVLLTLFLAAGLFAQNKDQPFSAITAGFNLSMNVHHNLWTQFWDPGKGFGFYIEAPFYIGNIQAGLISFPYSAKEEIYPNFRTYFIFLGLGDDFTLLKRLNLYSGLRFGYFFMSFLDDTLNTHQLTESEFSTGINFRINYEMLQNLFLSASSDFLLLFTHDKIKFYYISAGLAYKFNSPEWLKDFFN